MNRSNVAIPLEQEPPPAPGMPRPARRIRRADLLAPELVRAALVRSVAMLRPDVQWSNPVMFCVEIGAVLTAIFAVAALLGQGGQAPVTYLVALDLWLWATVLFANFATLAEARGQAQAESLRRTRRDTPAYRLRKNGSIEPTTSTALRVGDLVVVEANQIIPGDGEVIEGIASVDESAITGESAPVIREAGGDRSGVTGGTVVRSDRIVVRITAQVGESFPGPHDRARRGRHPAADAERDRADARAVGLAMNSGTQAAKEAGNMVDLDSDPTKVIEVVEIGKQLLMTRGALTTFSVANDVAKYFAIVPALFAGTLPWLKAIDVMHLHSPTSAILSAVIFNALIIPLLIPVGSAASAMNLSVPTRCSAGIS